MPDSCSRFRYLQKHMYTRNCHTRHDGSPVQQKEAPISILVQSGISLTPLFSVGQQNATTTTNNFKSLPNPTLQCWSPKTILNGFKPGSNLETDFSARIRQLLLGSSTLAEFDEVNSILVNFVRI